MLWAAIAALTACGLLYVAYKYPAFGDAVGVVFAAASAVGNVIPALMAARQR